MFKKLLLGLALTAATVSGGLGIILSPPVQSWAQNNPTCPTRPTASNDNSCASTAFVKNVVASVSAGVTSLGGMSGVLLCGSGLTCSAQTISVSGGGTYTISQINCGGLSGGPGTVNCDVELYARGVSVLDYGAACDGSTNDTTAIQTALNNARRVILPPNRTCTVTSLTISNQYQTFEGAGFGSILYQRNGSNTTMITVTANNVVIKDMQIYGNAGNQVGAQIALYVNNAGYGRFDNLYFNEISGQSFSVRGSSAIGNVLSRLRMRNCLTAGRFLTGATSNILRDSVIADCFDGVYVYDESTGTPTFYNKILNNDISNIYNTTNTGIEAAISIAGSGASFSHVEGNYIHNIPAVRGIEVLDANGSKVVNNHLNFVGTNAGLLVAAGIDTGPAQYLTITGNTIINGGGAGIFLSGNLFNTVSGNVTIDNCRNALVVATGGCAGIVMNLDPSNADQNAVVGNVSSNVGGGGQPYGFLEWQGSGPNYNNNTWVGNVATNNYAANCSFKGGSTDVRANNAGGGGCP